MAARRKPVEESPDVQISKTLTYILRHGADKEGIAIRKDGFVKVKDLFAHKNLKKVSIEDIIRIVSNCSKQRFHLEYLKEEDNKSGQEVELYIRANQGHTLKDVDVDLEKITDISKIEKCIHGTNYTAWSSIKTQGLSRMCRQHIHFSVDLPGSDQVISGMRTDCSIAIFIDVKKALEDGIEFYRSENNVILCKGDETGYLSTKYFQKVIDLRKNTEIEFEK